jgi:hypothetical protein
VAHQIRTNGAKGLPLAEFAARFAFAGKGEFSVNLKLLGAAALVAVSMAGAASAQSNSEPAQACEMHVYPADGVHSVGEDFDAVHQVDQDLRHYYETAGHSLDWLTPTRQLALLGDMPLAALSGAGEGEKVMHAEPLSRHQALEPAPRTSTQGCLVEIMIPQIMLERGGLATRSLRLFGVVRHYEKGEMASSYSGFAAAPMTGFQLKSPADADAATAIVETAYRSAVQSLLVNSTKPPKK